MRDERVILTKRKIQSDGFTLVWFLLLASGLIQQFVFHAPIEQYAVEFIIFFIMAGYILIGNMAKGNDIAPTSYKLNNTILGLQSALTGVGTGVMMYLITENNLSTSILTFVCGTVGSFILLKTLYYANNKKQEHINSQFDDEDDME
ncbi:MAG: hypothetical protein ATN33_01050 [Epulopiscium sp. Nele67-Bin001]|nr:MAG: hypothetical protein ATN33_01050 [Epulopiscium sp. Nele67-Bin001]